MMLDRATPMDCNKFSPGNDDRFSFITVDTFKTLESWLQALFAYTATFVPHQPFVTSISFILAWHVVKHTS